MFNNSTPQVAGSGKVLGGRQPGHYRSGLPAVELHHFVARGVTTNQFHFAPGAIQLIRQQPQERFVRRRVHGRGRDFYAQLRTANLANLILRGARLQFDRERDAVGLGREKGGECADLGVWRKGIFPAVHFKTVLPDCRWK